MALRSVTSYEVAQASGVSQSTVSRVFTNDTRVSPETKRRVLESATKLGYRVNGAARALASGRAKTLGIVFYEIDYMTRASFGGVLGGFVKAAASANYNLHFCCSSEKSPMSQMQHFISNAQEGLVDGMVIMDYAVPDKDILALEKIGVPFVLIDRQIEGREHLSVWNDHYGGAFLLARHLVSQGYSKIAVVYQMSLSADGKLPTVWKNRMEGVVQGCGMITPTEINPTSPDGCSMRFISEILQSPDRPDALLCGTAEDAIRIICVAANLGIRIPRDLGVAAFEDDPVLSSSQPVITGVRYHWDTLGEAAGRILIEQVEGGSYTRPGRPMPASLIARGSTNKCVQEPI